MRHVPSVLDVIKLDRSFRKRIQMLSNAPGVLRYGPDTVLQRNGWILETIPFLSIIVWYLMNGPILEPSKRPKIEHLKKSK